MLSIIASILGLIPGLEGLANNLLTAAFNAKVKMFQAKTGADRDVAVQAIQKAAIDSHETTERLKAVAGSFALQALTFMFATPFAIYIWKVVVWDIVLASITNGSTDAIKGDVASWGGVIIASLFGSASAVALGGMWLNRKTQ